MTLGSTIRGSCDHAPRSRLPLPRPFRYYFTLLALLMLAVELVIRWGACDGITHADGLGQKRFAASNANMFDVATCVFDSVATVALLFGASRVLHEDATDVLEVRTGPPFSSQQVLWRDRPLLVYVIADEPRVHGRAPAVHVPSVSGLREAAGRDRDDHTALRCPVRLLDVLIRGCRHGNVWVRADGARWRLLVGSPRRHLALVPVFTLARSVPTNGLPDASEYYGFHSFGDASLALLQLTVGNGTPTCRCCAVVMSLIDVARLLLLRPWPDWNSVLYPNINHTHKAFAAFFISYFFLCATLMTNVITGAIIDAYAAALSVTRSQEEQDASDRHEAILAAQARARGRANGPPPGRRPCCWCWRKPSAPDTPRSFVANPSACYLPHSQSTLWSHSLLVVPCAVHAPGDQDSKAEAAAEPVRARPRASTQEAMDNQCVVAACAAACL